MVIREGREARAHLERWVDGAKAHDEPREPSHHDSARRGLPHFRVSGAVEIHVASMVQARVANLLKVIGIPVSEAGLWERRGLKFRDALELRRRIERAGGEASIVHDSGETL